jgi:hypothetical protein
MRNGGGCKVRGRGEVKDREGERGVYGVRGWE